MFSTFQKFYLYKILYIPGGIGDMGEGGFSSSANNLALMLSSTYLDKKVCGNKKN